MLVVLFDVERHELLHVCDGIQRLDNTNCTLVTVRYEARIGFACLINCDVHSLEVDYHSFVS